MNDKQPKKVALGGPALRRMALLMREWSGWPDARIEYEVPKGVVARTYVDSRKFVFDMDRLVLNRERLLPTLSPKRQWDEAVLTGAMMHEAGHARFSRWISAANTNADKVMLHGDGTEVVPATMAFARVLEEPRIEFRMRREVPFANAHSWAFRAMGAHLIPLEHDGSMDANGALQMVTLYILRGMRAEAASHNGTPAWSRDLRTHALNAIRTRLENETSMGSDGIDLAVQRCAYLLNDVIRMWVDSTADESRALVDLARDLLAEMFPDIPPSEMPKADSGGCGGASDEGGEPGEPGEVSGNAEGEGSGEGRNTLARVSADAEREEAATEASGKAAADLSGESSAEGDTPATGIGDGGRGFAPLRVSKPTPSNRRLQREAEEFLRRSVNPTETTVRRLTDVPSTEIDGAALSAWRASGGVKAPRFFVSSKREITDAPPVKIAVLVDTSGSMDAMQKPSALLSWALANAAYDMRNFAGRGRQIQSTLIHWSTSVHVIQSPGQVLPGVLNRDCTSGTTALHLALEAAAREIPGLLDVPEKPENRLILNFTDWRLGGKSMSETTALLSRASQAGVNVLSILPPGLLMGYGERGVANGMTGPGRYARMIYNGEPSSVWAAAEAILSRGR